MGAEQIPEWVNLLATFVIIVIAGVTTKMGWTKAAGVKPAEEAEVVGAVVDTRAVKALSDLIEFALDRIINIHDEKIRHDKYQLEEISSLRKEIKELTHAIKNKTTREVD